MKEIIYYVPCKLKLTKKQVEKLEAAHREHWGDATRQPTNFDLVETAMREGLIEEVESKAVVSESGSVEW